MFAKFRSPHDWEVRMQTTNATRRCSRCDRDLPLASFNRSARDRSGLARHCAECSAAGKREAAERKAAETRARFADTPEGPNERAAKQVISEMTAVGEIRAVDADRVAALLGLGRALDIEPGSATLWGMWLRAQAAIRVRRPEDLEAQRRTSSAALLAKVRTVRKVPQVLTSGAAGAQGGQPRQPLEVAPDAPRARRREHPEDPFTLPESQE
jgi:hypothetical protein